jgi:hypothetical protein
MGLLKEDPLVPVMVRPHERYAQDVHLLITRFTNSAKLFILAPTG